MSNPHDGSRRIESTPSDDEGSDSSNPTRTQPVYGSDPTLARPTQPTSEPGSPVNLATTQHTETRPAPAPKTSAAAVFALVFGLAALFCALTAILSPAAILFGIIGLILAVAGLKMAKRPGITGKSVAVGGLVTALLGLVLGGVVIGGLAAVVNNKSQLDRIQNYLDDARTKLPSTEQLRNKLPGQ